MQFNAKPKTWHPVSVPPVLPCMGKSGAKTLNPFFVNLGINLKKFVPRPSHPWTQTIVAGFIGLVLSSGKNSKTFIAYYHFFSISKTF